MYFENSSPAPYYINQITQSKSTSSDIDKSPGGITPMSGRSQTYSNNKNNKRQIHRFRPVASAGEDSQMFTPTPSDPSHQVPPAFATNSYKKYAQLLSGGLMDFHKFMHKIDKSAQEYSSTIYDDSDFLNSNELTVLQNQHNEQNLQIVDDVIDNDDEKYPLDGPNIIHQNPIEFDAEIADISIMDNADNYNINNNNVDQIQ
eukprot:UN01575